MVIVDMTFNVSNSRQTGSSEETVRYLINVVFTCNQLGSTTIFRVYWQKPQWTHHDTTQGRNIQQRWQDWVKNKPLKFHTLAIKKNKKKIQLERTICQSCFKRLKYKVGNIMIGLIGPFTFFKETKKRDTKVVKRDLHPQTI